MIVRHLKGNKSEFSRQGWYPVRNNNVSTMQRKAYCRCLAFCISKGYETKPTAHLHPTDFLAQLEEHLPIKQNVMSSNLIKIALSKSQ